MAISQAFSRKLLVIGTFCAFALITGHHRGFAQTGSVDSGNSNVAGSEKGLRFSFRYAPWKEVLDWFAEEAGYSLTLESPPSGTFNYSDSRTYTPAEAIDILNSVLLTKGYTLVRRGRMLILVNVEDGVPPNLVENVTPEELDSRGEYELVSCVFQLERMTPEEADEEIKKLIGRQGAVIVLPKARQVYVTETAGKLRTIRNMIQAVEDPAEKGGGTAITQLPLSHISPDEALVVIRQIMGIEEDKFSTEDGSLTLSMDALGTRLLAKATPDALVEVRDILKLIDVPLESTPSAGGVAASPQLEVYSISNADPDSVLQVIQTLMAGMPDVRLSLDPKTNNLIALARPAQQQTIRATLAQLQREFNEIEVIQLSTLDPATAKLAVESLFNIDGADEKAKVAAPRVDANPVTRQLLVRGTRAEIDRIKAMLAKMGEDGEAALVANAERGNVRMVPMTSASAQSLLERVRQVWPTIRGNRIRAVTPSAAVNAMQRRLDRPPPGGRADESAPDNSRDGGTAFPDDVRRLIPPRSRPEIESQRRRTSEDELVRPQNAVFSENEKEVVFLAQADDKALPPTVKPPRTPTDPQTDRPTDPQTQDPLADIIVAPGPGGLLIASEDLEALDAFEELVKALSDPMLFPDNDYTVFYLKFAKAEQAAKLLNSLVSGGSGAAAGTATTVAFGSLLDAAASALQTSGPLQIVADTRINALIVKGEAGDVELIRQLLTVIDQEHSPENVQTTAPPRLIPVFNASASDVATVVKEIYASRMAGGSSGGNAQRDRQNFEQIIAAMREGRGGRGGGDGGGGRQQAAQPEPELTIGVDARSNSLIVSAPEPLFQEIKALVSELDEVAIESNEITRVVTVTQANPESIQKALGSLFGGQVTTNSNNSNSAARNGANNPPDAARRDTSAEAQDRMRRRMEFFNAMQRGGGPGGFGSGGFGRGGGPGGFGRGGDAGGRGGGDRGGGGRGGR